MRLCANENIAEDCVIRLRQEGHDVLWIRDAAPGSPDDAVLARAVAEGRLLITFDKDFGELVFRRGAKASHGIVLFRISQPSAAAVAERVVAILASRDDWPAHFSVVDDFTIRMRRLPEKMRTHSRLRRTAGRCDHHPDRRLQRLRRIHARPRYRGATQFCRKLRKQRDYQIIVCCIRHEFALGVVDLLAVLRNALFPSHRGVLLSNLSGALVSLQRVTKKPNEAFLMIERIMGDLN